MIVNKTILVTGGAGAIGSTLVRRLAPANDVIVLDNLSSGHYENIAGLDNVRFYNASILDDEILQEIFAQHNIDYVFHLAASFANQTSVQYPRRDLAVNGMGTLKLLDFAKQTGIKCFIYASSSCVYGNKSYPADEFTKDFDLHTPYAISKFLGEKYVSFYNSYWGLNTVIIRIFNSYGPGEYPGKFRNAISNFFWEAINNRPIIITGSGKETRDFTFNVDTVQGMLLAAQNEQAYGDIFNIGTGHETSIIDIARKVISISGTKSRIIFQTKRDWDTVIRRKANIEKANSILGYEPCYYLDTGLEATFNWFSATPAPGINSEK